MSFDIFTVEVNDEFDPKPYYGLGANCVGYPCREPWNFDGKVEADWYDMLLFGNNRIGWFGFDIYGKRRDLPMLIAMEDEEFDAGVVTREIPIPRRWKRKINRIVNWSHGRSS